MIYIRNKNEIKTMKKASKIVKETLCMIEDNIKPGITTLELDRLAEDFIRSNNAIPGFKGLYGFPATLCISIDEEVVHGIPSNRVLNKGEIVGIDVGSIVDGYYGDHARTFKVNSVSSEKEDLMKVTEECLMIGIKQVKPGNYIGDIGNAIQRHAEGLGYSVVRDLVGHGIGTNLHEDPQIPNYGLAGTGAKIKEGMCFAIEPMINSGVPDVVTMSDNWTICTADGKPSAHFEHTITVTENGVEILTK